MHYKYLYLSDTEISIKDKVDETAKLLEFLKNEQEKLEMSRHTFEIDRKNYNDYKFRLKEDVVLIEQRAKELAKIKSDKDEDIFKLKQKIHEATNSCAKIDEVLDTYKDHLRFIEDVYAFKGMQKLKHAGSQRLTKMSTLLPNFAQHRNILQEVVKLHQLTNRGKICIPNVRNQNHILT